MINVPNLKYKTTLCHNWLEGTLCEKAHNCYFAHGEHQLRKIQDNQQVIASRNLYYQNFQQSHNYKTVYCKFYAKGQCKLGASCTFAHQRKQKRKVNKGNAYEQPPIISYMPIVAPYVYPFYQNFDPSQYYSWGYQQLINVENQSEEPSTNLKVEQIDEIQPKSQEKKRSQIEERSTNEKEKEEVENQQDIPKALSQNKYFNFQ